MDGLVVVHNAARAAMLQLYVSKMEGSRYEQVMRPREWMEDAMEVWWWFSTMSISIH
jgi:hypothetical protein